MGNTINEWKLFRFICENEITEDEFDTVGDLMDKAGWTYDIEKLSRKERRSFNHLYSEENK